MRKPHHALIPFRHWSTGGLGIVGHLRLLPRRPPRSARRARQGALSEQNLVLPAWHQGGAGASLLLLTNNRALGRIPRRKIAYTHFALTVPGGEQSMDRVPAIDSGVVALGAIFGFVIYWNRRLPIGRRIDDLLEEYFEGRMPVGQLARAIASREVLGGPTFLYLPPPPFSTQLTLNGRSKPILRRRRN